MMGHNNIVQFLFCSDDDEYDDEEEEEDDGDNNDDDDVEYEEKDDDDEYEEDDDKDVLTWQALYFLFIRFEMAVQLMGEGLQVKSQSVVTSLVLLLLEVVLVKNCTRACNK